MQQSYSKAVSVIGGPFTALVLSKVSLIKKKKKKMHNIFKLNMMDGS